MLLFLQDLIYPEWYLGKMREEYEGGKEGRKEDIEVKLIQNQSRYVFMKLAMGVLRVTKTSYVCGR